MRKNSAVKYQIIRIVVLLDTVTLGWTRGHLWKHIAATLE